jgi:hypothetical protein
MSIARLTRFTRQFAHGVSAYVVMMIFAAVMAASLFLVFLTLRWVVKIVIILLASTFDIPIHFDE